MSPELVDMDGVGNEAAASDAAIGQSADDSLSTRLCAAQLRLFVSGQAIRTLDGEIGVRDRGGYK